MRDDRLEELLSKGEDALREGQHDRVRAILADMRRDGDDARIHYLEGMLRWEMEGAQAALALLRGAIALDPNDGDMHHALALASEEVGDEAAMVRHFVQTRILDARSDRESGIGGDAEVELILDTAEEAIAELPDELAARLEGVPIMIEPRPSLALVREGFDPRAFGLFEGPDSVERPNVEAPPRIVLYTSNLLATFPEDNELVEQVRITVLHEIAHYFGFEEEEMERLGLE
jgi:predicted Zn-dependent protease with MMP-like domain